MSKAAPRYVSLIHPPRAWTNDWDNTVGHRQSITIEEADPAPINTGLYDADGTPLYRVQDRVPLGFCR